MAPKETPKLPSHRAQSPSKKPGQSSNRPSNRDGQSSKRGDAPSSRGKKKKGKKKVKAKGEGGDGELEAVDEAAEEEEELEPVAEGGGGGEGGAEFVADLTGLDMGAEGLPVAELPTKLGHLTCAECKLKEIPADIGTLELLTKLDANSNELTSLPATIEGCAALETLEVYSNKIKELPASLGKLSKLKVLNAFNNQLRKLPAEIGGLSCLEEVRRRARRLPTTLMRVGYRPRSAATRRHAPPRAATRRHAPPRAATRRHAPRVTHSLHCQRPIAPLPTAHDCAHHAPALASAGERGGQQADDADGQAFFRLGGRDDPLAL